MNLIVAVDKNWAIGHDNELLIRIPDDMKRFRSITTGSAVIVGKKTLDSFPGGNPLPNRTNIVLCYPNEETPDNVVRVHSIDEAVKIASEYPSVYVIGGESVYRSMLDLCDTAHITKIDHAFCANRHFPNLDENPDWKMTDEVIGGEYEGIKFSYCTYQRNK